ncbi:MAG: transporter [Cyclobacteriaceae bacterium]
MKKYIAFSIVFLFAFKVTYAGGGWVYKKGKGFFKAGQSLIYADRFFDGNGEVIDITTIGLYTSSLYGEYGLTDKLTAIGYFPFFVRSTLNEIKFRQSGNSVPGDEVNALGDAQIGLKYGFNQENPIVFSVGLTVGIPLGETMGGEGRILQTGDGEWNQLLRIDASHSFYPKPFYASATLGFNNRTQGFSDEIHYGFELGYTPTEKITVIIKSYTVNSLYNGDGVMTMSNGIFSNNTEYFSIGPELIYGITSDFGFTAGAGFAFSGKRILASPNWSAGLFMTF